MVRSVRLQADVRRPAEGGRIRALRPGDARACSRPAEGRDGQMRIAIDNNQFAVVYQPIISLDTGTITGFEALGGGEQPDRVSALARSPSAASCL